MEHPKSHPQPRPEPRLEPRLKAANPAEGPGYDPGTEAGIESSDLGRRLRVGVVGAGAMGTALAALLGADADVILVCRDPLRAVQLACDGVRADGALAAAAHPRVVTSAGELVQRDDLDAVFIATKTPAIPDVAREIRAHARGLEKDDGTVFVSFQNGLDSGRLLMERLRCPRVLRSVLNFGATLASPGRAEITFNHPPHFIGGVDPRHERAAADLAELLTRAGLATRAVDDVEARVWAKSLLNASMNPVAAILDSTVGDVLASPAGALVDRLLEEGAAVARAEGVDLGRDFLDRARARLDRARAHVPTMVDDLRRRRPTEIGQLNRRIVERGRAVGVPTPAHEAVCALVESLDDAVDLLARAPRGARPRAAAPNRIDALLRDTPSAERNHDVNAILG